jgi:hypothetical protein
MMASAAAVTQPEDVGAQFTMPLKKALEADRTEVLEESASLLLRAAKTEPEKVDVVTKIERKVSKGQIVKVVADAPDAQATAVFKTPKTPAEIVQLQAEIGDVEAEFTLKKKTSVKVAEKESSETAETIKLKPGKKPIIKVEEAETTIKLRKGSLKASAEEVEAEDSFSSVKLKTRQPKVSVQEADDTKKMALRRVKAATDEPEDVDYTIDTPRKSRTQSKEPSPDDVSASFTMRKKEERQKSLTPDVASAEQSVLLKERSPESSIRETIALAKKSKSPSSKESTPASDSSKAASFTLKRTAVKTKVQEEEQKISFTLKKPPEFKKPLVSAIHVKEGETIIMACELTNPDAKAEWIAHGKALSSTQHYKVNTVGSIRELQVVNAVANDATEYMIQVGKASMKCVVTVDVVEVDDFRVCLMGQSVWTFFMVDIH